MTSSDNFRQMRAGSGQDFHRILITDCDFGQGEIERSVLGNNFTVDFLGSRDSNEIVTAAKRCDGLFVQWAQITSEVISQLPELRAIVRYGIGLDNVDLRAAEDRGVAVLNVDDYCIEEVADHAASYVIAANRRIIEADRRVKSGGWSSADGLSPVPPAEDQVGLVGLGRIGRAAAYRLSRSGFSVHYLDPLVSPAQLFEQYNVQATQALNLEELAERVDHLSLHVPLGPATRDLVDAAILRRLGPKGHIVNTSRGGLINEADLLSALDRSEIRWASLDVFSEEPPKHGTAQALALHPRVLSTPHMAYLSTKSLRRLPHHAALRMRTALA